MDKSAVKTASGILATLMAAHGGEALANGPGPGHARTHCLGHISAWVAHDSEGLGTHSSVLQGMTELETIGPGFRELALEPAVIQWLHHPHQEIDLDTFKVIKTPGFLDYAKTYLTAHPHAPASVVWNAYRERLGKRRLIRALVMTPAEASQLKQSGMAANHFRKGGSPEAARARIRKEGWPAVIKSHLSFDSVGESPLMSASGDSTVAQWAAQVTLAKHPDPAKKIFLVEFEAWNADIIDPKSLNDPTQHIEHLVYGKVRPEEILSVEEAEGEVTYRGGHD